MDVSGLIGSEDLNVTGSGTVATMVADPSGGDQILTSNGNLALADGSSGLAANYVITGNIEHLITKKPVTISGTRQYDGTTTINPADMTSFSGTVGTETLSVSGTSVSSANVANNYTVSGFTLADGIGAASNYTVSGNITANITQGFGNDGSQG